MKRKNDRTGSGGTAIVDAIVNLDMGWIYRPTNTPGTDYGVDSHLEVTDDEGVETGRQLASQVKSGQSYFREETDEGFIHRPTERHVRYWRDYALPVILILVNDETRVAYWAFTDRIEATGGDGWKLIVPRAQTLGPEAKNALSEAAVGGGTERTRARIEERRQAEHLRQHVEELEGIIATYIAQLASMPASSSSTAAPPSIDVLTLTFSELIAWADATDFEREGTAPANRTAYALAADQLFFRELIQEHDAAKAITLLLLAHEWGKAGSIFLYGIGLTRQIPQIKTPSILDFLAASQLPGAMQLDLRIILRTMHIAARRKHGRAVDMLLSELDTLVTYATPAEGYAVTAAAFWEARATGRTAPARAIRYVRAAAMLRPEAKGFGGEPYPVSLDETWRAMLELTASGIKSHTDLVSWLEALDAVPADARESFVGDEMNVVTLANRFWLDESARPVSERAWTSIHETLELLEAWSIESSAALLFAAARRGRVVVRGEYQHDLPAAIRLATDVPPFVREDAHAMFLLNEIAASQFLYADAHAEAVVAFRGALVTRPRDSSVLPTTLLKAAQSAAASDAFEDAVRWARDGVDVTRTTPYRASTDLVVAQAELALALWYAGDRETAFDLWDEATEELFAIQDETPRWRGLVVRFSWAGGYLANIYRTGIAPTSDAEGRPYGVPRPGAFLIDLTGQADVYTDKLRFGVLLGLAAVSDHRQRDARTRRWVYAALDLATERIPEWRRAIALLALPHLISDARYLEAVELGRAMAGAWESEGLSQGADGRIVAMSFSIVPSVLAIARRSAEKRRATAQAFLDALVRAGDSDVTGTTCREIVEITFLSEGDRAERQRKLMAIRNSEAANIQESPLATLCDIAASILPGIPIEDALALHARIVPELKPRLSVFPTMYRLHIVPFFRDYWMTRLEEESEAFNRPVDATSALRAIESDADAPKSLLLVVARYLRLS